MPFKLNPITGQLDLVNSSSSGSGNVTGIPPTDINAIARWDDTTATTIKNSLTLIQDGGGIEAQAFITRRRVTDAVVVHTDQTWIAPSLTLEITGSIVIEPDGEVIIV